ncbi:hypothetical protein RHRU231_330013 [Rhodococcus ruber]|uniref:Uncharacterized protein n=1 Tax=Rhodococcus ruber TaxID=1830 RepID=A0A098BIL9_9NOCA|nr:hypothetical protein RHRU231_330013 [Rhodococcus ruber]
MSGRTRSDGTNPLGLRTLLSLSDLELDPGSLVQRLETGTLDLRVVNEHVGSTAVLLDEAETLFGVEPLHSSLCHTVRLLNPPARHPDATVTSRHDCTFRAERRGGRGDAPQIRLKPGCGRVAPWTP